MSDQPITAAKDFLFDETGDLVRTLRTAIQSSAKDLGKENSIQNRRLRYCAALAVCARYFEKIGADDVGEFLGGLGLAMADLDEGVTDPLFRNDAGSKRNSTKIWHARMRAAIGIECLLKAGLSRKDAGTYTAKNYKALDLLLRDKAELKGALLSWYDRFREDRVPEENLQEAFRGHRRDIKASALDRVRYRELADQWLSKAVEAAAT
jgi:hypothetical protein